MDGEESGDVYIKYFMYARKRHSFTIRKEKKIFEKTNIQNDIILSAQNVRMFF